MRAASDNVAALETALSALDGLNDEHAAIIEHARTLAREIDEAEIADMRVHSEYRQVLRTLLEVGKKQEVDVFERILEELGKRSDSGSGTETNL